MIPAFYEDCEIFVTGGSGVIGKALIEKLLRSCNVRRIYVLLREKRGLSLEQRLDKIKNAKIFRVLLSKKPEEMNKIVPIPGDARLPNLGITAKYAKLMENVSIVFHCAATVRFDEPLKFAMELNVGGTLEALKFAETLSKLKIFMHVSTFFSSPYLEYVEPKIYPSPLDWKMLLDLLGDDSKENLFDTLTKKIITGFPNTYTFTKNLSESVVNDFRGRLPVAIFRPSIVFMSMTDPERGFPSTLMGASGIFVLMGVGILKTIHIADNIFLDFIPLDFCTKLLIYFTQKAGRQHSIGAINEVPVYMALSCTHSPLTLNYLLKKMNEIWEKRPFLKSFLLPYVQLTPCKYHYQLLVFTKQIIPALIGDSLLKLFGQKPIIMGIVRKVYFSLEVLRPFRFTPFKSPGITEYKENVEDTKGTEFEIDTDFKEIATGKGLNEYLIMMAEKIREIILNEDDIALEKARKIMRAKNILYNIIRLYLAYLILTWIYSYFFGCIFHS